MKKALYFLNYLFFLLFSSFLSLLPHKALYHLGNTLGLIAYFCHREFRKKTMTNLAIAFPLLPEEERVKIAKKSFQNLAITTLEFSWLGSNRKKLIDLIHKEGDGKEVLDLLKKGQGIVFMSAHQANWEVPFLYVTQFFPGVAIGKPIKNPWIYRSVIKVREMHGGKIIVPRRAIREGAAYLKEGRFLGIVADQAMPESNYSYPLFGTRAWTTSMPALLAIRTKCPLVVAFTRREKECYHLNVSQALWPNPEAPVKEESVRLMDEAMSLIEKSILKQPSDWLWQHDRFKQQSTEHLKREYRFGFILILLPKDPTPLLPLISLLQKIYERSFLTFMVPKGFSYPLHNARLHTYEREEDLCTRDWRYQLLFDFYDSPLARKYYNRLGVIRTLTLKEMKKRAPDKNDLALAMKKTILKPHCYSKYGC